MTTDTKAAVLAKWPRAMAARVPGFEWIIVCENVTIGRANFTETAAWADAAKRLETP